MRFEDLIKWKEIGKWLSLSESLKTTPITGEWLRKSWAWFIAQQFNCWDEKGKVLYFLQYIILIATQSLGPADGSHYVISYFGAGDNDNAVMLYSEGLQIM